jgi:hypothetical protein
VTKKDLVMVASRAFAMYLIIWALSDLSAVSIDILSARHYSALPKRISEQILPHVVLPSTCDDCCLVSRGGVVLQRWSRTRTFFLA